MKGQLALRRIAVALGGLCLMLGIWYLAVRPTTLAVAVGPAESTQLAYVHNLAKVLRESRQPFRLKVVPAAGTASASEMLDSGRVDLAVLRSDNAEAKDARSIVILHKRAIAFVSRKDANLGTMRDIEEKPIGVLDVDQDSYKPLVERIMSHYDVDDEDLKLQSLRRDDLIKAMVDRRIEGFIIVGNLASRPVREMMSELTGEHKLELVVKGVPAYAALALRFRELHESKIPEGVFGLQPEEEENTVGITLELATTSRMSEQTATALTRTLMEVRARLRSPRAVSYAVETPPVDEERRFLPHSGTAAFVNSEAKTLLEEYSDFIWLGLFGLGLVGSGIAGVMSWAGLKREAPVETMAERMRVLAGRLEHAGSVADVDAVQGDFDDLLLGIMREYGLRSLAEDGAPDPSAWLHTFGGLIERRRALLVDLAQAQPPVVLKPSRELVRS